MNRKLLNDREKIPMMLKEKIKKKYIYICLKYRWNGLRNNFQTVILIGASLRSSIHLERNKKRLEGSKTLTKTILQRFPVIAIQFPTPHDQSKQEHKETGTTVKFDEAHPSFFSSSLLQKDNKNE